MCVCVRVFLWFNQIFFEAPMHYNNALQVSLLSASTYVDYNSTAIMASLDEL